MPRAIWSGSISFGLVNVPVSMYSAIQEHDVHFHLLHAKDDSRIGYEKICKEEGKPVPDDEILKAYEFAQGEYVYMTDEDLEAAEGEKARTIDIADFVPYEEIDPIYFERTYYLGPAAGRREGLRAARRGRWRTPGWPAIATYVMRDKQHLGCLRVREGVIRSRAMYFADEVRPIDEIRRPRRTVSKSELEMAEQLIGRFAGSFRPEKYEDTYRDAAARDHQGEAEGQGGARRAGRSGGGAARPAGGASREPRGRDRRAAEAHGEGAPAVERERLPGRSRRPTWRSGRRRERPRPLEDVEGRARGGSQSCLSGGPRRRARPRRGARALFGLPLEEFTRERNELAKRLRAAERAMLPSGYRGFAGRACLPGRSTSSPGASRGSWARSPKPVSG